MMLSSWKTLLRRVFVLSALMAVALLFDKGLGAWPIAWLMYLVVGLLSIATAIDAMD